ncbi:leucine-rich repeat-containing protein 27-like [Tubulanus polymorphus]|uniref:leucine-rich repeat-containing protein 27-like n=1 Tax=Tubulanus polymorphus TaxID=672921 RepID=UPI003DA5C23D
MASDLDPEPENTSTEKSQGKNGHSESSCKTDPIVSMLIERVKALGSTALDLTQRNLLIVPPELLELEKLEYLYLEGNKLQSLPEDFFKYLPNLRWLDLRNNCLLSLPCTYTGRHQNLRNLLLEGNQLQSLPLELGLIPTLNGLNLTDNPIEFPPAEIIQQGCPEILLYLREMLLNKSQGKSPQSLTANDLNKLTEMSIRGGDSDEDSSDEDFGSNPSRQNKTGFNSSLQRRSSNPVDAHLISRRDSDLIGKSAALHKPVSYYQIRQQHMERLKKAGAAGRTEKSAATIKRMDKSASAESIKKLSAQSKRSRNMEYFPTPPPIENVEKKVREEKRLARIRELKEKQDLILQRRRDQEKLDEWRDETKRKQRQKYMQRLKKGTDFEETVKKSPYAIEDEHIKILSNEERIKREVEEAHEKIRHAMSPDTKKKIEEARATRDRELEKKINLHTHEMIERRKQPKGNPQDEMKVAKRELEMAHELQQQLQARRKQLEYRFQAFTGEMPASVYRSKPRDT